MRTLIIGCGYLGRRVGLTLVARGEQVCGLVRTAESAASLASQGITPIRADLTDRATLTAWPGADRVLHCIGFDRSSGSSMREVYVTGLEAALDRLGPFAGRFVFVSSTGVYGQDDGSWIDETSPTEPATESGRIVLEAERTVRVRRPDAVIVRMSGLYGPGRILRRASLERGEPIVGDPDHWLNLIHIDDAARCAISALDHESPGPLYVATDDRPIPRRDFYDRVAERLGLPRPRFVKSEPGSREARREVSSKRASNRLIKADLSVSLLYPDITSGLPAALNGP